LFFAISVILVVGSLDIVLAYLTGTNQGIMTIPTVIVGLTSTKKMLPWTLPILLVLIPFSVAYVVDEGLWKIFTYYVINQSVLFGFGFTLNIVMESNRRMKKLLEENELHDTIGHTFTSVIMGMDAVAYLMEEAPDKAKKKLEVLRNVTRQGLDEVRRSIHQIAPIIDENSTLSTELSSLSNEFSVHTGTEIRMNVKGSEYEVPKPLKLTLIRCLQESLTNAKRHGNAEHIDIALVFEEDQIILQVVDDGIGAGEIKHGFGLTAMNERLSAFQGWMQIQSNRGSATGTTVLCTVPLRRNENEHH
jgi:signal transduction histidine kinase